MYKDCRKCKILLKEESHEKTKKDNIYIINGDVNVNASITGKRFGK